MKLLKGILSLAIVFAFAATFAEADGKKVNCEICVTNCANDTVGVIINPTKQTYTSEQEFLADGGVFLNPDEEKCFEVKVGDHLIAAGYNPNIADTEETSCTRGQKRCFCVYDDKKGSVEILEVDCNGINQDR